MSCNCNIKRIQLSSLWERGNRGNKKIQLLWSEVKNLITSESNSFTLILKIVNKRENCSTLPDERERKKMKNSYWNNLVWYWNYHKSSVHELRRDIEMLMKWTRIPTSLLNICSSLKDFIVHNVDFIGKSDNFEWRTRLKWIKTKLNWTNIDVVDRVKLLRWWIGGFGYQF